MTAIQSRVFPLIPQTLDMIGKHHLDQGWIQDFLKGGLCASVRLRLRETIYLVPTYRCYCTIEGDFCEQTLCTGKCLELRCSELASGGFSVYRLVS